MVEKKCINIDAAQTADSNSQLGPEQWQALVALHRTLLYEHHNFLMATQHPSAIPALSGLAQKYSIPARMWKHGIHSFLEVLRHRLPRRQQYMHAFIYLAYQMMALLFEAVLEFSDVWKECLGDLARYRMAIEEQSVARRTWAAVTERWYKMVWNEHPNIGRLAHHLGVIERPSLRKLCFYTRALTSIIPFPPARALSGKSATKYSKVDRQTGVGSPEWNTVPCCTTRKCFYYMRASKSAERRLTRWSRLAKSFQKIFRSGRYHL